MEQLKKRFKKIYVEITNTCNLNCPFCKKTKRENTVMSVENFKKVAKLIKPFTDYVYLHVVGEPLLHNGLGDILDICWQNALKVGITTNGTLIKKASNNLLNKPALRQMNFSLHSIVGTAEQKNILLNEIFEFSKVASKDVYICYRLWTVSEENQEQHSMIVEKIMDYFDYSENIVYKPTLGNGFTITDNIFMQMNERYSWPDINGEKIFTKGTCYGLRSHIGILSDGTVIPCCMDTDGNIALGNIFEQRLEQILTSKRTQNIANGFRANMVVEDLCKTCGVAFNLNK